MVASLVSQHQPERDMSIESDEEEQKTEEEDEKHQQWRDSPYAVGLTEPRWEDEVDREAAPMHLRFTGYVCGKLLQRSRVGNLVVLCHSGGERSKIGQGDRSSRSVGRLLCVMGPYWAVPVFITFPALFLLCVASFFSAKDLSGWKLIVWIVANAGWMFGLINVATTNPGVVRRVRDLPAEGNYSWNDQALTFRLHHAKFDPDCAVLIDHYDHTCPWTGTAIGGRNMWYFRLFVFSAGFSIWINSITISYW